MGNQQVIPWNEAKISWNKKDDVTGDIPPATEGHVSAYDTETGDLYIFGGASVKDQSDGEDELGIAEDEEMQEQRNIVYKLTDGFSRWEKVEDIGEDRPWSVSGAASAILKNESGEKCLFICGGLDTIKGWTSDIFCLNLNSNTWSRVHYKLSATATLPQSTSSSTVEETSSDIPPAFTPRDKMAYTASVEQNCLYIFGGFGPIESSHAMEDDEGEPTATFGWKNDIWVFHPSSLAMERITNSSDGGAPTARAASGISLLTVNDSKFIYAFGGRDSTQRQDDLWRFDIASRKWERVEPKSKAPPARSFHSFTSLPSSSRSVCFGGMSRSSHHFNDVYIYDAVENVWVQPLVEGNSCTARGFHSANIVTAKGKKQFLVYGGSSRYDAELQSPTEFYNDLWFLDAEPLISTPIVIPPEPEPTSANTLGDNTKANDLDEPPPLTLG